MRYQKLVLVAVLLLMAGSVSGFNGERRGFVLGGGIGFAPVAKWSVEDFDESKAGVAIHLVVGHAWNDFNMIVYEGNVAGFTVDSYSGEQTLSQGFNGAAWYHYFGPSGKSAYTVAGLGLYVFDKDDFGANDPGFGVLLGGGYEFSRHWQVGGYLSFGRTSLGRYDYNHTHISVLISTVAF